MSLEGAQLPSRAATIDSAVSIGGLRRFQFLLPADVPFHFGSE
jgi:hypothetical protein